MPKKTKIILYCLIIAILCLKEEIYGFLIQKSNFRQQTTYICTIKNQNLEHKYNELVSNYQYTDNLPYHLEYSKVLYQDIYNLKSKITIYKGTNNNLKKNNLVINQNGLVGIISQVNKNSSEVDLLLNPNLNLSVKIKDSYGIIKFKNNELIVEGINNQSKILKNEPVYTSDISIYPENILIGYVKEVYENDYAIEQIIKINPSVNFNNLKYLSIITDLRGQE